MSNTKSVLAEPTTIDVVRKEVDDYLKEGRTTAFGGGSRLPSDTEDLPAVLTGNYQNIPYTNGDDEDKVLTLAEFKAGSIIDTTAVNHSDTRLTKGTKILVSVKQISGQMRNRITFA